MSVTETIAAGFERLEFMVYNSSGYIAGPTGTLVAGAAGAAAGRIRAVKTLDLNIPDPEITNVTGDNAFQGAFIWDPSQAPGFTIEAAINNPTYNGVFQTTNVVTKGEVKFGALMPLAPTYPDVCIIAVSNAKSKDSGSTGLSKFTGVIIPKCNIVPLGRAGFNERGEATYRFRVVTNMSDSYPWGETFIDADEGTTEIPIQEWAADNRITLHAFQMNAGNSITSFGPLAYTPVSTAKTILYSNGGALAGFSVNVGPKQIDSVTGSTANAYLSTMYEYTG